MVELEKLIAELEETGAADCFDDEVICVKAGAVKAALALLRTQEQEIQQLKEMNVSASGNAVACGIIHGGMTINQKAKEIMNIKHVGTFNG